MKIKPIALIAVGFIALAACKAQAQTTEIKFYPSTGYFLKNTVKLQYPVNYFVADTQDEFLYSFGVGRTMSNQPSIDSAKRTIAIALTPTDKQTEVTVKSIKQKDKTLTVNYSVKVGEKLTYKMQPVTIFQVDKSDIKEIIFTQDNTFYDKITLPDMKMESGRF